VILANIDELQRVTALESTTKLAVSVAGAAVLQVRRVRLASICDGCTAPQVVDIRTALDGQRSSGANEAGRRYAEIELESWVGLVDESVAVVVSTVAILVCLGVDLRVVIVAIRRWTVDPARCLLDRTHKPRSTVGGSVAVVVIVRSAKYSLARISLHTRVHARFLVDRFVDRAIAVIVDLVTQLVATRMDGASQVTIVVPAIVSADRSSTVRIGILTTLVHEAVVVEVSRYMTAVDESLWRECTTILHRCLTGIGRRFAVLVTLHGLRIFNIADFPCTRVNVWPAVVAVESTASLGLVVVSV
jgi:hypothetical protein